MHATISRRFTVTLAAVLLCTLIPWLYYGKVLGGAAERELAAARVAQDRARTAPPGTVDLEEARRRLAAAEKKVRDGAYELKFGLDLKGGASITFRVRAEGEQDQATVLKDAIEVIRSRVDAFGVSEVNISSSGKDSFTVDLPGRGKEEIERIKEIMKKVGTLEFRIVADATVTGAETARREREKEKYAPPPHLRWNRTEQGGETLVEVPDLKARADLDAAEAALKSPPPGSDPAALRDAVDEKRQAWEDAKARYLWTGQDLASVSYSRAPITEGTGYEVHFSMTPGRKSAFGDFTAANVGRQMAIVLENVVHSAPEIKSPLPGEGKIEGGMRGFSQEDAQDLATVLNSGSLQVKPEEISSFVVGPALGEDAVKRGRIAVGISFLLVLGFMALYYRGAGWVANLAVVLNLVMTLGILIFLGASLSLPSIAGLILTLGMAVDANILVNERIRDEKAAGKGLHQAIVAGYDRAWITILDSNLTTVLAGVVLYWVGTGPIRGFALTLILGLLISMFTACYVTRTIFLWGLEAGILKEFRMMPVMQLPRFRYTAARVKTIGGSALIIVLGVLAFALRARHEKYDLEFNGGQRIIVGLRKPMAIADLRDRIAREVPGAFAKRTEAAGDPSTLGDVSARTIRARGADAAALDLSSRSDRFEITAQVVQKKEGRTDVVGKIFADLVVEALKEEILPPGISTLALQGEAGKPERPFEAVLNLQAAAADPGAVRTALAGVPSLVRPAELKVEPAPGSTAGVASFTLSGASSAASEDALRDEILRTLRASPELEPTDPVPQTDFIGAGVALQHREQAIIAVLLSILLQIAYLRFRFRDFTYGFAAAIVVAHNVLITLGFVAVADHLGLAHVKINLPVIASFLTLIGYSVNDTIVVFDRIRENLGRSIHPTAALIDKAISDTLARSIRTSITVFFVALTLFVANYGATSSIEGFSFVMVVGVVTSAYASVFISSPLLLFLPVYGRTLKRLGQAAVLALIAALFAGVGVAFTQEGTAAVAGGVLAALLPAHFLRELFLWLRKPDPDALLKELEPS
jgi:SecD/SecF fusion protein